MTLATRLAGAPHSVFDLRVVAVQRLSPNFVRVTFGGLDLAAFADNGCDQRIKLVLPLADGAGDDQFGSFPRGDDWYGQWRQLPGHLRNPIRTYTVRRVHLPGTASARLDVDMVLHDDTGPATRWAARARIGDRLLVVGPNRHFDGDTSAVEFRPGPAVRQFLIGADASAVPAAICIAEQLPGDATGEVILEVADAGDRVNVDCPPGVAVRWVLTAGGHGDALVAATVETAAAMAGSMPAPARHPPQEQEQEQEQEPVDQDLLWEVPPPDPHSRMYIWLAGEAGAVTRIRRHLVRDLHIDRKAVAFLGYWRQGRAEG